MRLLKSLYFQVLLGMTAGVVFGYCFSEKDYPGRAASLQILADVFIKAVKMLIAPVIFTTVVSGIAAMSDLKKLGRVGWKALLYFEALTTIALIIGLAVAHLIQPGAGLHPLDGAKAEDIATYESKAKAMSAVDFLKNIVPDTFVGAFTGGEILQVLFLAILCGLVMAKLGEKVAPLLAILHQITSVLFGVVGIVVRAAPIAAFGAMAYTIGKFGLATLFSLGQLMACVYLTCIVFVFGVLGLIARLHGFSLWRMLVWIKEELLIVLGTSSSESALPSLMRKLERGGCSESVVGIVVPAGYSFNLDGTCIYLTMAALFVAQVTNTHLTFLEELKILGILLLTSKGAAAVTGGGFITLAATLKSTTIPLSGLSMLIGVDRFMSEARAITNLIGNSVATIVVSKWEHEFDEAKGSVLKAGYTAPHPVPEGAAVVD